MDFVNKNQWKRQTIEKNYLITDAIKTISNKAVNVNNVDAANL